MGEKQQKSFLMLGIETSCDDTCVAIYDSSYGVVKSIICIQDFYHNFYGGVVPKLAYKQHKIAVKAVLKYICLVLKIKVFYVFAIVYTEGPGLRGSLIIGATLAQQLGSVLHIPVYKINHIEGHVFSVFVGCESFVRFPQTALVTSGGHTLLLTYLGRCFCVVLGSTTDDAVGEVLDKIARYLGFGYPGGCIIEELSKKNIKSNSVNNKCAEVTQQGFNFSFSGLKTRICKGIQEDILTLRCISAKASFLEDILFCVLRKACQQALVYTNTTLLINTGGVCANKLLYKHLRSLHNCFVLTTDIKFSGDNAAMLTIAFYINFFK